MVVAENRNEYMREYKKNTLARISLDVKKDWKVRVKAAADKSGETLMGYIKAAVEMRMSDRVCAAPTAEKTEAHDEEESPEEKQKRIERDFGKTLGDVGKAAAERNRKQGKIVYNPEHGYQVVYTQD